MDLAASHTRREEILIPADRLARVRTLRQRLAGFDDPLAALLDALRATDGNDALLAQE